MSDRCCTPTPFKSPSLPLFIENTVEPLGIYTGRDVNQPQMCFMAVQIVRSKLPEEKSLRLQPYVLLSPSLDIIRTNKPNRIVCILFFNPGIFMTCFRFMPQVYLSYCQRAKDIDLKHPEQHIMCATSKILSLSWRWALKSIWALFVFRTVELLSPPERYRGVRRLMLSARSRTAHAL